MRSLALPLLRAAAWFEAEPLDPRLAGGPDGFLDLAWGKPDVAFVEPLTRRRLSPLARGIFHCAQRVSPDGDVPVVFASRHGEAARTLAILQDLAAEREVSPTAFSMSVHNAVPGIWSILKGNQAAATALAAGPETFGWGLVEALGIWRADPVTPVLYLYGEEPLPELWAGPAPQPGLHTVALLLGAPAARILTVAWDPALGGREDPVPQSFLALAALRDGTGGEPGPGQAAGWEWKWAGNPPDGPQSHYD